MENRSQITGGPVQEIQHTNNNYTERIQICRGGKPMKYFKKTSQK